MKRLFDVDSLDTPDVTLKSNEWYTPSRYIEAARAVMGGVIDLDPASCALANETVKATRYFTKDDDGLSQAWSGNVWLNPPYGKIPAHTNEGRSYIGLFVQKLMQEYRQGNVSQAVALVTAQTDAAWFAHFWHHLLCLPDHKIRFWLPYGTTSPSRHGCSTAAHMFGTVFVYLGPNTSKFVEHFSEFGPVITPVGVHRREQVVQQPTLWEDAV
jgi:ParB family transcriptional regulator, chromosome partitioning protein